MDQSQCPEQPKGEHLAWRLWRRAGDTLLMDSSFQPGSPLLPQFKPHLEFSTGLRKMCKACHNLIDRWEVALEEAWKDAPSDL